MQILIVEDDFSVARVLTTGLKRWDYKVDTSKTGRDALAKLRRKRFDLVLLDLFLPDGKGYDFIPEMKRICPEIGIVTLTGHNSREMELKTRTQGIIFYMIKPVNLKVLKSILDHISTK